MLKLQVDQYNPLVSVKCSLLETVTPLLDNHEILSILSGEGGVEGDGG